MCGILTWITRGRPIDRARLRTGLGALAHRGPDASDLLVLDNVVAGTASTSIGFAHARLAIVDPKPRSDQPFRHGDHVICYNGEIYDHRSLAARFGVQCRNTDSDTEVLLSLLAERGPHILSEARGMWAFTWFDAKNRRIVAARDRYGKKPLFYFADAEQIVLGSEVRALASVLGRSFSLRDEALATFLADGWLLPGLDGSTHLHDIREVRPGHLMVVDLDTWSIEEACLDDLWPQDPLREGLYACLVRALADRLAADRPVGLLLSGGLDSTLILAILANEGWLDRVTCFIGDAGKSDDAAFARSCVSATGARAVEVPLDYGGGSTTEFLNACRSQAKPFPLIGNVLGTPALYREMASRGVRVALDGTGADELFGGYWDRYAGFAMRDAARSGDIRWLQAVRSGGMLPPSLAATSDIDLLTNPSSTAAHRHGLFDSDRQWLKPEGLELVANAAPGDPLANFDGTLAEALTADARNGRMQEWLWHNDRNAMAVGVENRSPFLDHRLAGWANTPYYAKFDGSRNKCELRAILGGLPQRLPQRLKKQGFRWVYGRFLRQNRRWITDLVQASSLAHRVCRVDDLLKNLGQDAADQPLLQRLCVLAGLEATGAVGV